MPLYKRLLEELRGGDKKVSLIPNGIDLSPVDGKSDFIRRKEQLGFPLNGPLVGAVGNIKPVKGYDVLIDAALHVIREEPGASILIIGGTYQYEDHFKELKALVRERNLQGKVYFLGKRNDVREILPLLDVYVLPSRSEGTSIALLEAMASKRAIVATKVGGTTEVIEDSRTGLLVPPDNPAALGKAIIQLLQNKSFAVTLGENARKRAEKEFSVGTMVERYLCLYNEILD
jgi:glycosyltransferase involved in cell wall biosynthesis